MVAQVVAAGLVTLQDLCGALLLWEESCVEVRTRGQTRDVGGPLPIGGRRLAGLVGGLLCPGHGVGRHSPAAHTAHTSAAPRGPGGGRSAADHSPCTHRVLNSDFATTRACDDKDRCGV